LDRANQSLFRDATEIRLAPKAFAVLLHLADHSGSLITKDELLDAVWGDLHVTDGALKRCVADRASLPLRDRRRSWGVNHKFRRLMPVSRG
jgi:DNA-binding winged helix-turn-helix (wHTH) protein